MGQWSDYSTGERIKLLRGPQTQEQLAGEAGLSVHTIRKAEHDQGHVSLQTLLLISAALHADVSVILGQQAPRRAMQAADRAMLRALSLAVHDSSAGIGADVEPPGRPEVEAGLAAAWEVYRAGNYARAGVLVAPALREATAALSSAGVHEVCAAHGALADAYRLAAYVANQFGGRDLAYAAIGHAHVQSDRAGDPVRGASTASGRSWIYMRDARLDQAQELARVSYESIEPRFGDRDLGALATYGWHVTLAAVVAARMDDVDVADDLLKQGQAVAARMGCDITVNGTAFGPVTVAAQAIGISVSTGRPGKALADFARVGDTSVLTTAARRRMMLDVALAQADARQSDAALDTLLDVCSEAPEWARHQALPGVIAQRASAGSATFGKLRRLAAILGTSVVVR
ncbi:helix-turn-helix domain-containing protein [Streptacidiphilus sp. P02-A3a]|uniref:helix-turn-helix domain-containing protein n=1 Tax=Streptacidiphilus sp. P02-A3a TaxID=2704468 RepID=UPI0015FAF1E6|nr:helix-turn-helix transcriptional regulator [Streptacidiphilus sp. P02-A3a]QMU72031.1 helix-turn-helix transcriptional regulator [Streptacidiphilus sp. P02-A3a]